MRLVRPVLLILILGVLAWLLARQWQQIPAFPWRLNWPLLFLSFLALQVLFFLDALGWHFILREQGCAIHWRRSVRVWMLSSLARYLPGGVWSYAGRVLLAKREGVGLAMASLSLYYETLLLLVSSLVAGMPALLGVAHAPLDLRWLALGVTAGALALHPAVVGLLRRLPGRAGQIFRDTTLLPFFAVLRLYVYYLVFWALLGGAFALFAQSLYPLQDGTWLVVAAALPLGFLVGFVAVIVPGGLGVRESALYLLLAAVLPPAVALVIALSSRLWIMAGEAGALGVSLLLSREYRRRP